jgi:hypothetical protein
MALSPRREIRRTNGAFLSGLPFPSLTYLFSRKFREIWREKKTAAGVFEPVHVHYYVRIGS